MSRIYSCLCVIFELSISTSYYPSYSQVHFINNIHLDVVDHPFKNYAEFFVLGNMISCCSYEQVGLKMFLGVTATVGNWNAEGTTCSLILEDNPLVDFVELPDTCQGLYYCNILSGVIRGALEMVSFPPSIASANYQFSLYVGLTQHTCFDHLSLSFSEKKTPLIDINTRRPHLLSSFNRSY